MHRSIIALLVSALLLVPATSVAPAKPGPVAIARHEAKRYGWVGQQFRCLKILWHHESGWNPRAHNPSSGAHGIPQALPGSKMASAGPGWWYNARTQIRWGLRYIKGRYGTPCGAWAWWLRHNWY